MRVCFETFGCRLNKAEALQMEAEYLSKGWELTDSHSAADLFIVRGCSVTARAQAECTRMISHLRRHYPNVPVRVCGCFESESPSHRNLGREPAPALASSDAESPLPTRTARAYLKVQDGCSGKCTFCIVPKFRGASRSVGFSSVLDTAKRFIDAGYHEIVVTGCNLALYASEGKQLPDLLSALSELSPVANDDGHRMGRLSHCRIRLGSIEPGDCAREVAAVMAERKNICRFLHLPIQSGSDRILTAMNRPYRVADIESLALSAKEAMPDLGLGCDIMTGFPNESDADFAQTKRLLERLPFDNAHVFPYSERKGTFAAGLGGSIPNPVRSRRAHEIARIMKFARDRQMKTFIGRVVEVVNESKAGISGWTEQYFPCDAVGNAPRKALVRIFVTGQADGRLVGRLAC